MDWISARSIRHAYPLDIYKSQLKDQFERIGFGKNKKPEDTKDRCFWAPASVNHNVENNTLGTSRYSLFTYGGVLIAPNINIVKGNGGPLGGTPVSITASGSNQGSSSSGGAGSSGGGGAGSSGGGASSSGGGRRPPSPPLGSGGAGTSNAAHNCVQYEAMRAQLRENMEKPVVKDSKLQNIVDDLYKPNASVGSGSTAAAIRQELSTGNKVGGKFHLEKGEIYRRALINWIKVNPTATPGDRATAEDLLKDLNDAMGYEKRCYPNTK